MKQVLIPHPIAEKCFLIEALYWVAFKLYPLHYESDKRDIRENFCYHDGDGEFLYNELEYFFTEQNCIRNRLSINPKAKYWESNAEEPMSLEVINIILKDKSSSTEATAAALKDKDAAITYNAEIENWEESLDDYLEPSRAQIFLALKNGRLKASGQKIGGLKNGIPISQWENEENWDELEDWEHVKRSDIPKEFWRMDSIDWHDGSARSSHGYYTSIIFDMNELLSVFPESAPEVINIHSINGTLLLDENDQTKIQQVYRPRGRPAFKWKEFTREMVRRYTNKDLPTRQKSCVIEMKQWRKENWGTEPSDTNLKEHISPFYFINK